MVNSEKKAPYSWNQKSTLYSCDYLSGQFPDIDTRAIEKMVLENHAKKRVMHEDPNNIRGEDIRIDYDENIKKLPLILYGNMKPKLFLKSLKSTGSGGRSPPGLRGVRGGQPPGHALTIAGLAAPQTPVLP